MAAKPVQISMDTELLRRIDEDPEARTRGRSAFVRSAVRLYLTAKERQAIEAQLTQAYSGEAEAMLDEVVDLLGAQAWPDD
jgi:metal-responsive CopG/Arc/MetJ family transcriptional regulator